MATYYVANSGNDLNEGTIGEPWAHHPWMSTWTGLTILMAGDTVYMKCGDTWTIANPTVPYMTVGQNGMLSNPITTTYYGSGARPIINISTDTAQPVIKGLGKSYITFDGIEISGGSKLFSETYDYTGIYFGDDGAGNVSHNWVITNCTIHNFRFGGILGYKNCYNILIGDSSATSVATESSYNNHIYDIGRNAIWLQGTSTVDGVANWQIFKNYIHDIRTEATASGSGGLAYGIAFCSISTSAGNPSYAYMRYNLVKNVPSWTAYDCHGGDHIYIQYNKAYNCNLMVGLQSYAIGGSVTPNLDYVYLENNEFENPANLPYDDLWFVQCNGGSAKSTYCYIRNNTMFFTTPAEDSSGGEFESYGIKIAYCSDYEITGNKIYNGLASTWGAGIFIGDGGTGVENILIDSNFIQGWRGGIYFYNDKIHDVTISNNILSVRGYAIYGASDGDNVIGDLSILNNVLLTETYDTHDVVIWMFAVVIEDSVTVTIKNNVIGFRNDPVTGEYIYAPTTIDGTFDCDYNLYFNTTDTSPFALTGSSRTWDYWQNTAGLDTHSPNVTQSIDPLFTNGGGSYELATDFNLQSGSPAIGAGEDVGLTEDYGGYDWLVPPSIGALEYGGSSASQSQEWEESASASQSQEEEEGEAEYSSASYESASYDTEFRAKYRLQFHDIWDVKWTALFHIFGYSGEMTDLQGSEEAIVFDFQNISDDPLDPIRPSSVTFNILNDENFSLYELYSVENMQIWVEVFQGEEDSDEGTPYWAGWVDPKQYEEPYDVEPNVVNLICIDGLSLLEEMLYAEEDSVGDTEYYDDRRRESQIILDILGKIGYSEFKEFVNLYEEDMPDSVEDSPMDKLSIDTDFGKERYCDEVLFDILRKYNACITQIDGVFCIYRPKEIIQTTVFGRHFTSSTVNTAISYTADQFINRAEHDTNLKQVPGGVQRMVTPAKKITIFQDYGNKESWIKNWEFKPDSYNKDTGIWDHWTGGSFGLFNDQVPDESDGIFLNAASSQHSLYTFQLFAPNAKATANAFGFSFDYYVYGYAGTSISDVYIELKIEKEGTHWLQLVDENTMNWDTSEHYVYDFLPEVENGRSGWQTFSRTIDGLPADGPFYITLYNPWSAASYEFGVGIKNIRFFATSDEVTVKKRTHKGPFPKLAKWVLGITRDYIVKYIDRKEIIEREIVRYNDVEGKELEYNMYLGDVANTGIDNVPEQFSGALCAPVLGYREDRIVLDGYDGRMRITCNGVNTTCVFGDDLEDTASDYVDVNGAFFLTMNITLSYTGSTIKFTSNIAGMDFIGTTSTLPLEGTLTGDVTENYVPATSETNLRPTTLWQPRYESSEEGSSGTMQTLLDVVADEIQHQYSRATHFISMKIQETSGQSTLNRIGNIQDTESALNGTNRKYVINRGTFEVRSRRWDLDLHEIVE